MLLGFFPRQDGDGTFTHRQNMEVKSEKRMLPVKCIAMLLMLVKAKLHRNLPLRKMVDDAPVSYVKCETNECSRNKSMQIDLIQRAIHGIRFVSLRRQ